MKEFGSGLISLGCKPSNWTKVCIYSSNRVEVGLYYWNYMTLLESIYWFDNISTVNEIILQTLIFNYAIYF